MPIQAPRQKAQGRHTSTQVLRQQSGKAWWSSSKITRSKTRPDKAQREANRRKEEQRQCQREQEGHEWCHSTPSGSGASSSSAYPWAGTNCNKDWEAYDWSTGPWEEQPASSSAEQSALSGDGYINIWSSPSLAPHPDFGEILSVPSPGFEEDASQSACFGDNAGRTEPAEQSEGATTPPCRQAPTPPEAPHRALQDRTCAVQEGKVETRSKPPPLRMGASGLPEVPFPDLQEAKSYQHMRLSKPAFLASLRLVRGLCCYGCNVSFSIGQLSSHLFSARHQRICLDFSRLGPAEQRIVVQGTAE